MALFAAKTAETADLFQKFSRKKKLDRMMLETLVQEIRIFEDQHIEVVFKFADVYQSFLRSEEKKDDEA